MYVVSMAKFNNKHNQLKNKNAFFPKLKWELLTTMLLSVRSRWAMLDWSWDGVATGDKVDMEE
jgi:hypothetical protein